MAKAVIEIPDECLQELEAYKDRLGELLLLGLSQIKIQEALLLYQRGLVSFGRAAELSGLLLQRKVAQKSQKCESSQFGLAVRDISGMIPFLVVNDPAKRSRCVKDRVGQDAPQQKANLLNGQGRSEPFQLNPQPYQKVMGQERQGHMMMPSQPAARFVVVQPNLVFVLSECGLNPPAALTDIMLQVAHIDSRLQRDGLNRSSRGSSPSNP